MERGRSRTLGVLIPVSENSDDFNNKILAPIQSAYLYEESKVDFKYHSALIFRNPALEKKYAAFRAKKKQAGYTEEDLEETYGFMLFDDIDKANALGQTGVLTGTTSYSFLGDPSKGVYISMYSDCLERQPWRNSESGYIAIIRLTTGRVGRISESHGQSVPVPTSGFDCHVSQNLALVSPKTSSPLAFKRTQCYIYELLDDGSDGTAKSPSFTCPFGIVAFKYSIKGKGRRKRWTPLAIKVDTQPRDLFASKILRVLPVLGYAGVLLNPVMQPCPPAGPGVRYIALSSPEPVQASPVQMGSEKPPNCEMECGKDEVGVTAPQTLAPNEPRVPNEADDPELRNLPTPSTSDDVPSELIVSFTSEQSVPKKSSISPVSTRKPLSDEHKRTLECPKIANVTIEQQKFSTKGHKKTTKAFIETPALEKVQIPSADDTLNSQSDQKTESSNQLHQNATSNKGRKTFPGHTFGRCSSQKKKGRPVTVERGTSDAEGQTMGSTVTDRETPSEDDTLNSQSDQKTESSNQLLQNATSNKDRKTFPGHTFDRYSSKNKKVRPVTVERGTSDAEGQTMGSTVTDRETPSEDDTLNSQSDQKTESSNQLHQNATSNKDRKTFPGHTFGKYSSKNKKVRPVTVERGTSDAEGQTMGSTVTDRETPSEDDTLNSQSDQKTESSNQLHQNATSNKDRKTFPGHTFGKYSSKNKKVRPVTVERGTSDAEGQTMGSTVTDRETPSEDDTLNSQSDQKTESSNQLHQNATSNKDRKTFPGHTFGRYSSKNKKVRPVTVERGTSDAEGQTMGSTVTDRETPSEDDTLNSQSDQKTESSNQLHQNATSNKDRKTFPEHTFGRYSSKNKKVRPVTVERGTSDAEGQTMGSTVTDRETPKCERWNLKPVISECGRTLVPHGSRRTAVHRMKSLPEQNLFRSRPNKASDAVGETEQQSITPPGSGTRETEVMESKTLANYPENVSPEQSTVHDSGYGEDALPAEDIQERGTTTSSDRRVEEDEPKCILSNRARTKHHLSLNGTTEDPTTELPLKKSKSHTEVNPNVADEAASATKDTDVRDTQDSTQAATIKRSPSSIFPKWKQFKKLKKQQAISKLHIKKKWRLHFQTSLEETGKRSAGDDTIWKKNNISNTSTDALNLLADLALGATNEQVLSQPGQELMSDDAKGVASTDQVSLLYALLGKPVFKPTQPLESQSVLAEDMDLVSMLREEHAYSIHQFVPLALPGKEFKVSPLSGSTGLLHHYQTICSGQTLHFSDDQSENSQVTSKHARKCMARFQRYRSFVEEGGSIKVTRQWQEMYDFGGDSRFSLGLKNRSIIRALHGPWDISIQDSNKDIQLVVYMWIGLFYSRSTARFFDVDLDLENLEEMDCLETMPARSDLKENPFLLPPGVVDTAESSISNSLVLSQKGTNLDQESEILDLSLKNPNVESLTSGPTFVECQTTIVPAETLNKCNDVSSECSRTNLQEDSYPKDEGEPSLHEDVPDNHLQGQLENNDNHDVTRMDHGLHESNSDRMDLEGESENVGAKVLSVALKHGEDSLGAENEVYKDVVNPVPQIEDDKESDAFCKESILATERLLPRDDPEDVQVDNLNDKRDYFVKNDILISTSFSVQQGIDTVLPTSNTDDRLGEIKTTDVEHTLDQTSETNKYASTFPVVIYCTKNKNAQPVQAASTSQSPQSSESSEDPVALPLNNKSKVNPLITEDTSDINVLDAIEVDEISQRTSRIVIAESAIMSTDITLQCCPSDFQMDERNDPRNDPGDSFQFLDPLRQDNGESVQNTLKSSQTKYRFYILEKSEDSFYAETKSQLESEGHTAVQPSGFFLAGEDRSPLLIVVRNEDIAASICEVPHLLELKKSLGVQFVGIDEPSDVMNRTYQELFVNGGFVMFDGGTLESLSLYDMRRFMEILQDLNKTGKWKWFLHYRDSRRIKDNARFSMDAEEKKHFLGWAEDAGLATVLPYHDCDIKSRAHPDYLACLVHLQAQNISSRFPVFITDTGASDFEASGILTTTIGSFLMSFR
ncbi:uncharacterized protein tasor2 isoform X2 [Entelurus aequoreus]|uniref:uncharacterized protein tasor2 isoform X2 n=1 Tax=Entelurus aequoreus TaxID=161455 RepID=UPI002B1E138D|nr:uncharacterized protein tasor2 isoform X2 [Entelurus aequoreus]